MVEKKKCPYRQASTSSRVFLLVIAALFVQIAVVASAKKPKMVKCKDGIEIDFLTWFENGCPLKPAELPTQLLPTPRPMPTTTTTTTTTQAVTTKTKQHKPGTKMVKCKGGIEVDIVTWFETGCPNPSQNQMPINAVVLSQTTQVPVVISSPATTTTSKPLLTTSSSAISPTSAHAPRTHAPRMIKCPDGTQVEYVLWFARGCPKPAPPLNTAAAIVPTKEVAAINAVEMAKKLLITVMEKSTITTTTSTTTTSISTRTSTKLTAKNILFHEPVPAVIGLAGTSTALAKPTVSIAVTPTAATTRRLFFSHPEEEKSSLALASVLSQGIASVTNVYEAFESKNTTTFPRITAPDMIPVVDECGDSASSVIGSMLGLRLTTGCITSTTTATCICV